jgi:putative oxidoreductase
MILVEHMGLSRWSTVRIWFVTARCWLSQFPLWVIQLAMRVAIGMVFFNSGLLKLHSWEFAIKLFQDEYKVPLLDPIWAARLAAFNELTFPIFLFIGLATRLATLPLLGMVAVIQICIYPGAWAEHLLWASILIFLLTRGPGTLSVDYLIDRHLSGI